MPKKSVRAALVVAGSALVMTGATLTAAHAYHLRQASKLERYADTLEMRAAGTLPGPANVELMEMSAALRKTAADERTWIKDHASGTVKKVASALKSVRKAKAVTAST